MLNRLFARIAIVVVACFLASCTMRTYVQDRGRVDQEMTGNAGCIQGACPQVDRGDVKQTRRTYVLEVVTNPKKIDAASEAGTSSVSQEVYTDQNFTTRSAVTPRAITLPDASGPVAAEKEVTFTEYKIKDGDTLQKISKEFYGTYGRWNDIYQVNKDVLTNPDRIKPGKVIRVPQN